MSKSKSKSKKRTHSPQTKAPKTTHEKLMEWLTIFAGVKNPIGLRLLACAIANGDSVRHEELLYNTALLAIQTKDCRLLRRALRLGARLWWTDPSGAVKHSLVACALNLVSGPHRRALVFTLFAASHRGGSMAAINADNSTSSFIFMYPEFQECFSLMFKKRRSHLRPLETRTVQGLRPLHAAAIYGSLTAIKFLATQGVSIDATDIVGKSALFLAAMGNQLEACQLLVQLGANWSIISSDGRQPIDIAPKESLTHRYFQDLKLGAHLGATLPIVPSVPGARL